MKLRAEIGIARFCSKPFRFSFEEHDCICFPHEDDGQDCEESADNG